MLYLLYGTDTQKSRNKLHELLALARKKRPDAEVFRLHAENWNEAQLDELLASRGLFESKYTVVLDGLLEKKETKLIVLDRLEALKESDQIFLMIDGGVDAATVKKIEKVAQQVQESSLPEKKPTFNIFGITDKLLQKDKKGLWVAYNDMLGKGAVSEEIHGILFWQIKNMLLASRTDQKESGLSPFVYKNALTGARNFKEKELMSLSSKLVDMTHRVRTGEGEMEVMLEKWILEL